MQKILYKTKAVYTFEEYSRYNKTIQNVINKTSLLKVLLSSLTLLAAFVSYKNSQIKLAISYVLIAILVPLIFSFMFDRKIKKYYESNSKLKNMTASYNFYKDHMSQNNSFGHGKIDYKDIYTIIETKNNFYIMLSKRQGCIIIKQNCSDELIEFLRTLKDKSHKK